MTYATSEKRQMKFAVFMHGDSNYHSAGWRHPDAYADGGLNAAVMECVPIQPTSCFRTAVPAVPFADWTWTVPRVSVTLL